MFKIAVCDYFVLLQSVYKLASTEKADLTLRMIEMSIHGHKVADDNILATAQHRNVPTRWEIFMRTLYSIKVGMDYFFYYL